MTSQTAAEFAADLDGELARLTTLEDRILLARERIQGRIAFSTSLGLEDQAALHAIAATGAAIHLFTLDTGRLFPETLETLAESEQRYGVPIHVLSPDPLAAERLMARDGALGFRRSVEARQACCAVRKIEPLKRGLSGAAAWLTGLRRGQSAGRGEVPFAAWDDGFGLLKLNPLADWPLDRLEAYVAANDVPTNPLHRRGFPSIGCQPCTRAIAPGEDIRAGRWWWEQEQAAAGHWGKECGLHAGPQARRE